MVAVDAKKGKELRQGDLHHSAQDACRHHVHGQEVSFFFGGDVFRDGRLFVCFERKCQTLAPSSRLRLGGNVFFFFSGYIYEVYMFDIFFAMPFVCLIVCLFLF